mgnify:CR=1 FL=1
MSPQFTTFFRSIFLRVGQMFYTVEVLYCFQGMFCQTSVFLQSLFKMASDVGKASDKTYPLGAFKHIVGTVAVTLPSIPE